MLLTKEDKQTLIKNYLKYIYCGDPNNMIIENYNNFKNTSLKDTPESLKIIINDEVFINDFIKCNEENIEEIKEEVEEWEEYYYPWKHKKTN